MGGSHLHVVVMGVAGTGKSTVAQALSGELDLVLTEGDDHHPRENIEKMSAGRALDDDDRAPWLAKLAEWTRERHEEDRATVLTCSALRRTYRDVLRSGVPEATFFVHLSGSKEVLTDRMENRDHFMPASLLDSQLDTLEPLEHGEDGEVVDVDRTLDEVVRDSVALVRRAAETLRR
jgi:gluconokinase